MADNVKIKVTRENKDGVHRSFVLIDDRVLPFENGDEINVFVEAGRRYGIVVYCEGPLGANTTATVSQAGGKIIPPLMASVETHYGVGYASNRFTAAAR